MTVKELKDLLASHPDDMEVILLGWTRLGAGPEYMDFDAPEVHYANPNNETARQEAGKEPFTHAYDYNLNNKFWLAEKDFTCEGRFGANSSDTVFVPAGISVKCSDHTTVIYVDDWERTRFVPAYSNTV